MRRLLAAATVLALSASACGNDAPALEWSEVEPHFQTLAVQIATEEQARNLGDELCDIVDKSEGSLDLYVKGRSEFAVSSGLRTSDDPEVLIHDFKVLIELSGCLKERMELE